MIPRGARALTPQQSDAVSARGREVLVVAPAGSGKTEVLIQRVIRICQQSPGESFRVLAVTFTVRAAQELRRRAEESIADELWRVDSDTLHGFALEWLRRYGKSIGIAQDVVVFGDDLDREGLIVGYLQSLGLDLNVDSVRSSVKDFLGAVDRHRTEHIDDEFCCSTLDFLGMPFRELADSYEAALRSSGGIDFAGILLSFRQLLHDDPWVLAQFQSLYRQILVDEGQDLTPIQADLLSELAGDSVDVFVVADDRQSIYGYAGGDFENARKLVPTAADKPIYLHHNFRCATNVLSAAEAIAVRMPGLDARVLSPEGAPPGEFHAVQLDSVFDEAAFVVDWVSRLLGDGLATDGLAPGEDPRVTPEDIAIVGRTRWTFDDVVGLLRSRGIEHMIETDAAAMLPEPEGRIVVECLAYGLNDRDLPAARRASDEITHLTGQSGSSPLEQLDSAHLPQLRALSGFVKSALDGPAPFQQAMNNIQKFSAENGWPEGGHVLSSIWTSFLASTSVQGRHAAAFLQFLGRAQRTRPSDPGVRVLTIHKVKGLEFKAVAVIGAYDGSIPHYRAVQSSRELDEERRALYVAMTRAARSLLITWPRSTVDRYGRTHHQEPSRFLRESELA